MKNGRFTFLAIGQINVNTLINVMCVGAIWFLLKTVHETKLCFVDNLSSFFPHINTKICIQF